MNGTPLTTKPLRAITLLPSGRCGCSQCVADEKADAARRDAALRNAIYEAGREQLRAAS